MDPNLKSKIEALAKQSLDLDAELTARADTRKKMTDDYTAACAAFDAETAAKVEQGNSLRSLSADAAVAAMAIVAAIGAWSARCARCWALRALRGSPSKLGF